MCVFIQLTLSFLCSRAAGRDFVSKMKKFDELNPELAGEDGPSPPTHPMGGTADGPPRSSSESLQATPDSGFAVAPMEHSPFGSANYAPPAPFPHASFEHAPYPAALEYDPAQQQQHGVPHYQPEIGPTAMTGLRIQAPEPQPIAMTDPRIRAEFSAMQEMIHEFKDQAHVVQGFQRPPIHGIDNGANFVDLSHLVGYLQPLQQKIHDFEQKFQDLQNLGSSLMSDLKDIHTFTQQLNKSAKVHPNIDPDVE